MPEEAKKNAAEQAAQAQKQPVPMPTTYEALRHDLIASGRAYDFDMIDRAYQLASAAHATQFRRSGEPYICHPISVAQLLVELGMDSESVAAALMHDVAEDTPVTVAEIKQKFGPDVALLVDGVTKLTQIKFSNVEDRQAENLRKMLLAMSQDVRVMIIKLCDRLHNMRTGDAWPEQKRRDKALETMEVYAPIAHRLGISNIKEELEDRSLQYLDPVGYNMIRSLLNKHGDEFLNDICATIQEHLEQNGIHGATIRHRVKSIYGIYRKMYMQNKDFEEIYDIYAVRIIIDTVAECYTALGLIHDMYHPLPNRFKDYLSTPKSNMYQSLHTTVLGRESIPFEIQIRTWDMHVSAEYGIAAHWKYKEGIQGKDKMEERLAWVRKVIEAQQTSDDVEEIVRAIKNDLSPEDIVVMTPRGDSISLPVGSTVIDFAYRIHTEIGHKTIGGKVDGKMVPLDYPLQTGQICEVLTSKDPNKGPNRAWLGIVKTNEAKSKIRSWFKKECREENIATGKANLEQEFKRCHINLPETEWGAFLADDLKRHNCDTLEDFYASIGYGGVMLSKIMPRLKELYVKSHGAEEEETNPVAPVMQTETPSGKDCIVLDRIDDCVFKFAQCCNPLPGDDIVGFITRGHGISVHTKNCVNYQAALKRNNPEEMARWLPVQWTNNTSALIPTGIEVIASDRVGLVFDITKILSESHILIVHSSSRNLRNGNAIFEASVQVAGTDQLQAIMDKLRKIRGVISVERAKK